jgi:hypothetical protein
MHRTHSSRHADRLAAWVGATALLLLVGVAHAQSTDPAGTSATTSATTSTTTSTTVAAEPVAAQAQTQTTAQVAARAALAHQVETTGAATSSADLAKQDAKMVETAHKVDTGAAAQADASATLAARMAKQFHMEVGAVMTEKQQLDISWGNLMIAHTLSANAKDATSASVENLVGLHKDCMGWGKIAAGLGFKLGRAVAAVETEGKVAQGQAEATGKVARIAASAGAHGDPDAAGGEAAAHASAEAATHAAGAAVHVGTDLHVGNAGK